MQAQELSYAVEALLFAQATPMDFAAIRAALRRAMPEEGESAAALQGDEDAVGQAVDGMSTQADGEAAERFAAGALSAAPDAVQGDGEAAAQVAAGAVPNESDAVQADGEAAQRSVAGASTAAPAELPAAPVDAERAVNLGQTAASSAEAPHESNEDADADSFARSMSGASAFIAALDARQSTVAALALELAGQKDADDEEEAAAKGGDASQFGNGADADAVASAGTGSEASVDGHAASKAAGTAVSEVDVTANDGTDQLSPLTLTSPVIHTPKLASLTVRLRQAMALLQQRWQDPSGTRGFGLVEVAGGYAFRTHPRFAALLRGVREHRPQRLSRPALESLSIVAYRQPVTKPEVDHLRGVDSGGSLKVLLERRLVTVVGKKEEPGRPLLYGTTPEFLSFFNLGGLTDLPSLREFHDLNDDDQEAVRALEGLPDLASLAQEAKNFRIDEAIATDELEDAIASLQRTQGATRAALLAQGVRLSDEDDAAAAPPGPAAAPTHH